MRIYSIVRVTQPGACCSYPVGRFEVYHTDGQDDAESICATFNLCRAGDNLGFAYSVEAVEEESPLRAPESTYRTPDCLCVPNVTFTA